MARRLIKNGKILNIFSGEISPADILVNDGIVSTIGPHLRRLDAEEVDASDMILMPGLVDAHSHLFHYGDMIGINPVPHHLRKGVTFAVDQGSAGADNYEKYREVVLFGDHARTKAFLNCSRIGINRFPKAGELLDPANLDERAFRKVYSRYTHELLGLKIRISPYACSIDAETALRRVIALAQDLNIRIAVHATGADISDSILFGLLREGDIYTHCYNSSNTGIIDRTGKVKPAVLDARERGVIFDTAHGTRNLAFSTMKAALSQGFGPDIISTDLHNNNVDGPVFDLATTISKFLSLGMSLRDAVYKVTVVPSQCLNLNKSLAIEEGRPADIAAFSLQEGTFPYYDSEGESLMGHYRLKPEFTILENEFYTPVQE